MDAFETLMASLLEREGYWTTTSFKVELTKAEKRQIGKPSSPRWELDLVAYKPSKNELLVVECKSYLNSRGVIYAGFDGSSELYASRYKLFNGTLLRRVVLNRLERHLIERGLCRKNPKTTLALAAGRIATDKDREALKKLFAKRKWLLFDEEWIYSRLTTYGDERYANDLGMVVAKLLLGNPKHIAGNSTD